MEKFGFLLLGIGNVGRLLLPAFLRILDGNFSESRMLQLPYGESTGNNNSTEQEVGQIRYDSLWLYWYQAEDIPTIVTFVYCNPVFLLLLLFPFRFWWVPDEMVVGLCAAIYSEVK